MAHERLGERLRYRVRRLHWLAGLALVGALLIGGCNESEPVDPGQLPDGGSNQGGTGGGGSDSTAIGDTGLVGTWNNVTVPENDQDVRQVTTTWVFRDDGVCARSIVTESLSAGTSVLLRVGVCRAAGTEISVLFTAESVPFSMIYGFPNPATLTLDGVFYDQVATQ